MLVIVSESLQVTLGITAVSVYSFAIASICFFISGVNTIDTGLPIP